MKIQNVFKINTIKPTSAALNEVISNPEALSSLKLYQLCNTYKTESLLSFSPEIDCQRFIFESRNLGKPNTALLIDTPFLIYQRKFI